MRDYVDVLSERSGKLGEMVNSLFSLAKASSGNVELKMERFEMNRLIDQIFADMDDRMKESGLEFITQKTEESTEIVSDNMYCYRICQNLLENALKYSAKGTRVFVKTYVKNAGGDARRICLEMTNTAGYFMISQRRISWSGSHGAIRQGPARGTDSGWRSSVRIRKRLAESSISGSTATSSGQWWNCRQRMQASGLRNKFSSRVKRKII